MDPNVKPQTLVETFDQANYNSIPEYNVALITLLTCHVSIYTAERSFSSMKRLQTPFRRTMADERLSSLAILHIHKHVIDFDGIRLFTVPYFFVRSFIYTASYRHGYLDL